MPQWLMVVSWLAIILGVLTAIVIALHEVAHPQHMKIMNVVWPVTGLYVPVIGWWASILVIPTDTSVLLSFGIFRNERSACWHVEADGRQLGHLSTKEYFLAFQL
jgi:hypothetical protein